MKIRKAEKKDCTRCMEIAWSSGLMSPDYEGITVGFYEAYVNEDGLFFVSESGGDVVGFVLGQIMKADYADLSLLAVDHNHRRQGIGTALVNEFKERCYNNGVYFINIMTQDNLDSMKFWNTFQVEGGQKFTQVCITKDDPNRSPAPPLTIEGRWDIMYSKFPEKYDEFCSYESEQDEDTLLHNMFDFNGKEIVDIGSGTGESTFYFAKYAKNVIGVEPEKAMNDEALRKAKELGIDNVRFVEGKAQSIPLPDNSADMVVGMYFQDYPQVTAIPDFIKEATRVIRSGGMILVTNNPPGWYGGELDSIIKDNDQGMADERHRQYVDVAGFDWHDVYAETDRGSVENMISSYGFIFGMKAINYIRKHNITRVKSCSRRHFKIIEK